MARGFDDRHGDGHDGEYDGAFDDDLPPDAVRMIPVFRDDDATRVVSTGGPSAPPPPLAQLPTPGPRPAAAAASASASAAATTARTPQQRSQQPGPGTKPVLAVPPSRTAIGAPPKRRGPARRVARILAWVLVAILVYAIALVGLAYGRMDRVDATPDGERPADGAGHTFLLVGSDSRENLTPEEQDELGTGSTAGKRTDTILMLHRPSSGPAVLISLPRDSYVPIPGHGRQKLNAAYAIGGAELLVETVEGVTGVRIDDYVEIGFGGFFEIVQATGGVRVCLDEPLKDEKAHVDLPAGCQMLDGAQALGYVRARYSDPRGDLGRVERQQAFLRAMAARIASPAVWANPVRATRTSMAAGDALTIGEDTGLLDLATFGVAMLSASGENGINMTVPIADTPTLPGVGSVVRWDRENALALFNAIAADQPVPPELLAE